MALKAPMLLLRRFSSLLAFGAALACAPWTSARSFLSRCGESADQLHGVLRGKLTNGSDGHARACLVRSAGHWAHRWRTSRRPLLLALTTDRTQLIRDDDSQTLAAGRGNGPQPGEGRGGPESAALGHGEGGLAWEWRKH